MEELRARVEAVERALTDGEGDLSALAEGAATADRVEGLAADVEALQDDVAELEAATQALRGYVGNVRSVNEAVEERADGAAAAVESVEQRVEALEEATDRPVDGCGPRGQRGERTTHGSDAGRRSRGGPVDDGAVCRACGRPEPDDRGPADGGGGPSPTGDEASGETTGLPETGGSPLRRRTSREATGRRRGRADPDRAGSPSAREGASRPIGDGRGTETGGGSGLLRQFRELL